MADDVDRIVQELNAIKRLLIAALMKSGMPQDAVAKALGVNQSSVSRMLAPASKTKKQRRERRAKGESQDGTESA